jgi:hypothetical protein
MTSLVELLQAALPMPNPMVSEEQADRAEHRDIRPATTEDLLRELTALRLLNYFGGGEPWHELREDRINEELATRRRRRK